MNSAQALHPVSVGMIIRVYIAVLAVPVFFFNEEWRPNWPFYHSGQVRFILYRAVPIKL